MPSLPGTGAREQLGRLLIADETRSADKLVVCPPLLGAEWKQHDPGLKTVSQQYVRLHIDELLENPPELLIIEDPHGKRTVPLLQRLAAAASRSIIRPFSGLDHASILPGFPGEYLPPLSVDSDSIDGYC